MTVDDYRITTDPAALDLDVVHRELAGAYWSVGIPREVVERAFANSLAFAVLAPDGTMAGFARVVTDTAIFAHVCDVVVLDTHRGRGLGKRLMEAILAHPDLEGIRRVQLHTRDAHGLYARYGFGAPARPESYMVVERDPTELYRR